MLRYCGSTDFVSGQWAGIELNDPVGKNDGSVNGIRYFKCRPKYGKQFQIISMIINFAIYSL